MKKITTGELKQKLENNDIKLVEVLSEEEYNKAHIKGAVNIPLEKIVTEASDKFDKEDEIVVYCSDKNCTASPTAAKKLKDSGFTAVYHYEGGKKAWKEAGLPME
ncbi:MAG: rhodanese-like domain-containing protein [Prolixibacteraceae bacterium]